jgi:hypothetical protein
VEPVRSSGIEGARRRSARTGSLGRRRILTTPAHARSGYFTPAFDRGRPGRYI